MQSRQPALVFVLCLGMLGVVYPVEAQQQGGTISGQVTDESGGVLPGVTVTLTSPALQVQEMVAVTTAQGEYRLTPLPIGVYTLTYALDGFQTLRREGIRVDLGAQARVDVRLGVGALEETVTVSGAAPVVDVTATSASTQFTRETLELTPTARNGAISLMAQAPGVRSPGKMDVGGGTVGDTPEFSSFGQPVESYIQMENMVTSDTRIGSQGGNYFDYNTMEEAKVQTISNGPEVPSRGPALSMIVKAGGNEFHGSGEYAYTSHSFESDNIDDGLRAQGISSGNPLDSRTDNGASLGGRIIRDKLWFFGAGRYRPQRWLQLGGVKPDGTQADAYRGEIITNEKISYQLSQANKLVFWGQWNQKYHYGENVNEFVAWESRGDRIPPIRTNIWNAQWQSVVGNSFVFSALFGRWTWTGGSNATSLMVTDAATAAGVPGGLEILHVGATGDSDKGGGRPSTFDQVTLEQAGTPTGGGSWNDIWRYTSKATMSWYKPNMLAGNHEFRAGVEYSPSAFIQGNGDRGKAGQYRLIYRSGVPTQMELYNYPVIPQNDVAYFSVYGSDSWTIARRLTLDLGGRFEHDSAKIPAQGRQAGAWVFTPAQRIDVVPFNALNSFAPRLYFSLDVTGNGRTVLKGGWGRFMKQRFMEENQFTNPFSAVTASYRWHDNNGNRLYDPGEVDDDPNGPDFISSNQPVNGIPNPDEKVQGTDQFALTLERQLGQDFAVRVSGVYVRSFSETFRKNVLRPDSAYSIPVTRPDPGNDGVIGNADDPGTSLTYWEYPRTLAGRDNELFQIFNVPELSEKHTVIDAQLIKRISNNWQFLVAYAAIKNRTPYFRPDGRQRAVAYDPNLTINTLDTTTQTVFRVSGLYMLPYGFAISANFNSESGLPQARQVLVRGGATIPQLAINAEPIGSLLLPTTSVMDVRINKTFAVGSQRVGVRVNFFNALNANTVVTRTLRAGASYLRPTSILKPRIVELGINYTF